MFVVDPNAAPPAVGPLAGELVTDGGFEAGTPNPSWTEASTNFGTPLCDVPSCGLGGGTGPFAGAWWAWFGGITAPETGSIEQNVQSDATDTCTLSFMLEIPAASGNGTDFLRVFVGGTQVFEVLENAAGYGTYAPVNVDVSAQIDGTPQVLRFESTTSGVPGVTNFFVDDVSLFCVAAVPTMPPWGLLALGLALLALALWSLPRIRQREA